MSCSSIRSNTQSHTVQRVKRIEYSCNSCISLRPVVKVWTTVTRADSTSRVPCDASNHFVRSNVLSCAENVAKLVLPRRSGMCGSCEILRNVVGKKHSKHEKVVTEPRSPGTVTWRGQRTWSCWYLSPPGRADGGNYTEQKAGPQKLSSP